MDNRDMIMLRLEKRFFELYSNLDDELGENDYAKAVVLPDESGIGKAYEMLDEIIYQDKRYAVLMPIEDGDSKDNLKVMHILSGSGSNMRLREVASQDTIAAVSRSFYNRFLSEFKYLFE